MNRLWWRSAAISCAMASCALAAGPGLTGIAFAHADLFGFDFCGHDDKSEMHHPRPGSDLSAQTTRATTAVAASDVPTAKIGSAPESVVASRTATSRLATGVVDAVAAPGGGGAAPRATVPGRAPTLPRVSTAPSTRSVVIRTLPDTSAAIDSAPVPRSPAAALAAPAPEFGEPEGRPAPGGPPAPAPASPWARNPLATGSGKGRLPSSYRAGYAEYLRVADTSDLLVAALPGAAGIAGFTIVGAYAGYRQARAVQKALVAPAPTSILL